VLILRHRAAYSHAIPADADTFLQRRVAALSRRQAAAAAALGTLPFAALGALMTNSECNHLNGDIKGAQAQSHRGAYCDVVLPDYRWVALIVLPCLVAAGLILLCGERKPLYVPAWAVAVGLVFAQVALVTTLRPYEMF
jgi:hypothetical protein